MAWAFIAKAAMPGVRSMLRERGVIDATSFAQYSAAIDRCVQHWAPPGDSQLPSNLKWPKTTLWPLVLVHVCELPQVVKDEQVGL